MWKTTEAISKVVVLLMICVTVAQCKYRTKRYLPQLWRMLAEVEAMDQQDGDTMRWYPDSYDYGALADRDMDKRVFDSLGGYEVHGFKKRGGASGANHRMKRFLDTLGGFQVHGWKKRSLDSLGGFHVHGWKRGAPLSGWKGEDADEKRSLSSLGNFQVHGWKKRSAGHPLRLKREAEQLGSETLDGSHSIVAAKESVDVSNGPRLKRSLSSLGGFQVHGWKRNGQDDKRGLSTLGDFQLHGYKRGLSPLGDFQLHGYKRGLSTLGGFNVHGYKRGLSTLGGFNVHGYKRDGFDDKRALSSLGDFQIHGYKRGLSSLGDFNLHGYKRGLSSLGDFNLHGYKRGLSSLGDFNLHGYKRGLSSLGDFNLHGYKRGLSTLGGFQVHGWKRNGSGPSTNSADEEDGQINVFSDTTESIPAEKEQKNNEILKVVPIKDSDGERDSKEISI